MNVPRLRSLVFDAPRNAMVAYSLFRDPRVPPAPKAALLAALGVIVSPIDVPAWIPVIGQMDILALSVLAIRLFIEACPEALVKEHEEAVKRGDSRFHHDAREAGRQARERALAAADEALARWRARREERRRSHSQDGGRAA